MRLNRHDTDKKETEHDNELKAVPDWGDDTSPRVERALEFLHSRVYNAYERAADDRIRTLDEEDLEGITSTRRPTPRGDGTKMTRTPTRRARRRADVGRSKTTLTQTLAAMNDEENTRDVESAEQLPENDGRRNPGGAAKGNDHARGNPGGPGAPPGNSRATGNRGGPGAKEGNDFARGNPGGAPELNQNAQTHGLFSSHDGYYHDLDAQGQAWIEGFLEDLLDRHRDIHRTEPDQFDREALKNIAIDFHRVARANSWFAKEGMAHEEEIISENYTKKETKINVWAAEIRKYNESVYRRMKKHGLLEDPDSKKAEAGFDLAQAWREGLAGPEDAEGVNE